jgi:pimeloyl-ACP methyl ester carboxylesterase
MLGIKIFLIVAGGVFKKSSLFFEALRIFLEKFGIMVIAVDFPQKTKRGEKRDPRLGKVGIMGYVKEVLPVFNELYAEHPDAIFILGGHSMGAMIMQKFAEKLGNKIHGLILLSPVPSKEIALFSIWGLISFGFLLPSILLNRPVWRPRWATDLALFNKRSDETYREKVYSESVLEDGAAMGEIIIPWKKLHVDTSKIKCPVLVICGDEDRLIYPPKKVSKNISDSYAEGRYEIIPGASHDLFWGKPGITAMWAVHAGILWIHNRFLRREKSR